MGSKGGVAPSPSSVVCCMCGDHGLQQELFRCKVCLVRSQHKYCSDLYPKAESYRACNWCLREEAGGKTKTLPKEAVVITTSTTDHINGSMSSSTWSCNPDNSSSASGGSGVKLRSQGRALIPSQINNKPVKKQRMLDRSTSSDIVTDRTPSEEQYSPSLGRRGRKAFIRGKARRYKLLEEVSS